MAATAASVIIPTFCRPEALMSTLRTLQRNLATLAPEVIVVDDGSPDGSFERVQAWLEGRWRDVRLIRQPNRGAAAARNRGASEARRRILVFIDNDILVGPQFLDRHLTVLASHPQSWVIGRVVHSPELRSTPFGRFRDHAWERFHRDHGGRGLAETDGITAANLALPADDFHRLGGFDESFSIASCEDWDLGRRAREAGIRILYDPDNVAIHDDWAGNLERFCDRQYLYSVSDVLLWRKYGERSPRQRLVHENAPLRWTHEPPSLLIKKLAKQILATSAGRRAVFALSRLLERALPDTAWCWRSYDLAVAVAIFRGVREGFRRYRGPAGESGT